MPYIIKITPVGNHPYSVAIATVEHENGDWTEIPCAYGSLDGDIPDNYEIVDVPRGDGYQWLATPKL